ncbi:hypothetical protein MUN84_14520 [Hymenobacter sp. 5516J-16]|uniref:hypothetical protein n=1 Tax=Hymenobacter sp. 5516J-16 TaxID=2932253 RepID=UPI001FD592F6|nr:hypothetical protein [Hymenobacter sp. 5516J-16]UOQ75843.1 hypothetical protein MUN84_14520 [Hymenobacter sp. 5516J-16]
MKAWDTWNNSAERAIEFIAAPTEKLALQHVLNYPNPFASATTFHFDHNRQGEELEVQVQIFTVSGKLVRTLQASALSSGPTWLPSPGTAATSTKISWRAVFTYTALASARHVTVPQLPNLKS